MALIIPGSPLALAEKAASPLYDYDIVYDPVMRWNFAHCVALWPCRDLSDYGSEVRPGVYSVDLGAVLGHHPPRVFDSSVEPRNRPGR